MNRKNTYSPVGTAMSTYVLDMYVVCKFHTYGKCFRDVKY